MIILYFVIISFLTAMPSFAEDDYRDPFTPLIHKPVPGDGDSAYSRDVASFESFDLILEGVMWGEDVRHAIINGDLYKEGDTIKDTDAKIIRIKKDVVSIYYEGVVYERSIEKYGGD